MPSTIAWLDASADEQRRMREIVALFSSKESRDELGVGQIRDVVSEALFPGTSVLLTRARYLLFVPWCFQLAAESGRLDADRRRDRLERDLIEALRAAGATDGLLGLTAGRALKNLPSAIYWNALRRWGVLASPSLDWQDALSRTCSGDEEQTEQVVSPWSLTTPSMPAGFPLAVGSGFDLTADEAGWLRDRILNSADGTLLAHLAEVRPSATSDAPWLDLAALTAAPPIVELIEHARQFSLLVHGAALLYNLLLAESYAAAEFEGIADQRDHYRSRLEEWQRERDNGASALSEWDRARFYHFVSAANPAISPLTWRFVNRWHAICTATQGPIGDDSTARDFITARELEHKRGQARLRNRGLLALWAGAAGSEPIRYRWGAARRILLDIHDGLERPHA